MAATVLIEELNLAAENATDKTSGTVRFKSADNSTVDNNNRIVVPTANTEYSFEKWLRLNVTIAPAVDLQDMEFYMDGANGWQSGIKLWADTIAAFDGTNGATKPVVTNDPPFGPDDATPMVDAFSYTSGAPLDIDVLNTGPHTGTGQKGDYLVLVMEVEIATAVGALTPETATFRFKET